MQKYKLSNGEIVTEYDLKIRYCSMVAIYREIDFYIWLEDALCRKTITI